MNCKELLRDFNVESWLFGCVLATSFKQPDVAILYVTDP
jgi:hypothetical protein